MTDITLDLSLFGRYIHLTELTEKQRKRIINKIKGTKYTEEIKE